MADPLDPEDIVPPSGPITSGDLGPIPEQYEGRIGYLESEAEEALRTTLGDRYKEDPFTIPLKNLPRDIRDTFVNQLDELTGMKGLIAQGQGPTMFRDYTTATGARERSPAGRFVFNPAEFTQEAIDPRILRLSQQTTRYDHARSIAMTERYYSAGTHLRQRVINNLQKQIDNKLSIDIVKNGNKQRGSVLVFDVETPGLNPEEGIWQISGRMMHGNGMVQDFTRSFNNPRMRWGGEVGQTRQSLQDFLNPNGTFDFEEGMREFLEIANKADFVAGHNVLFDYRMLQQGLTTTPAYKKDREFRTLADTFMEKFYNPSTKEMGNVIDTAQLSRAYLHNIPLAEELRYSNNPRQFSMENILLQTNLLERVKREIGGEKVSDMLSRGTHFADVDVVLESYLLKFLQEGAQGFGPGLSFVPNMTQAERAAIIGSRPFTPNIPLAKIDQLHPLVAEKAAAAGLLEEGTTNITPLENMVIASRDLNMQAMNPATRAVSMGKSFLSRFQLKNASDDMLEVANSAGIWNRMFGGNVTGAGTIRREAEIPLAADWAATQRELRNAHIPLPGLSWIERHLTATIGMAGRADTAEERSLRSVFGADVAPLGRFFGSEGIDVVGKSQITKVPMSVLEEWEQARREAGETVSTAFTNPGENAQFLHGSFFNVNGHSEMSLVAQIEEDEKENLLNFLKQHPSIAGNDALISRLESSFAENTGKYGVQVGTLTGLHGGMGVENVRRAFEQVMGVGADYSDQTPTIKLPYVGRNLLGEGGGRDSLYTMGALINTDVLDLGEKEVLARSTAAGAERYRNLARMTNTPMMSLLKQQAEEGLTDIGPARQIVRGYGKLRENAPIIGLVGAVAGLTYYRHKKHKRDRELAETMALQPTSPNPRQNYGLVQQLDSNKIGHTNMGASKYSYLFGTGYQ